MSDPIKNANSKNPEARFRSLEGLATEAIRHPQKAEGDVCIGMLPTRGGNLVVWSSEEAKGFCKIAGQSARRLGYLPWGDVQSFLRDRLEPLDRKTSEQTFSSGVQTGAGQPSLTEDENPNFKADSRGTVVELREVRPRTFFWETLREILPPGGLKVSRR